MVRLGRSLLRLCVCVDAVWIAVCGLWAVGFLGTNLAGRALFVFYAQPSCDAVVLFGSVDRI